jgi:membrane associated rhomboid family serine protease
VAENPFRWLLVFIAGVSLLNAVSRGLRARRELPGLLVSLGWAAAAILALRAKGDRAITISALVVFAGMLVTEIEEAIRILLRRARLRGRYAAARLLSSGHVLVSPSALHRAVYRGCAALHDCARGRRSIVDLTSALASLADDTPAAEVHEAVGATLEALVREERWEAIASWFDESYRSDHAPLPAPVGVALVTGLCASQRFADAAAVVAHAQKLPAVPTGEPADTHELAEIDGHLAKARLIFLAHTGHGRLVERLARESARATRLFRPDELACLHAAAAREPPPIDPETAAFAERVAADLVAESALHGAPVSTAGRPWGTVAISVACVLVYVGVALTTREGGGMALLAAEREPLVTWGAVRSDLVRGGELYRLFASTLLHANIIHLFMNLRALWEVGGLVEHVLGRAGFLLVYLLSGIAGSLACVAVGEQRIVVGASGAVCGVLAAGWIALRQLRTVVPTRWHQLHTKRFGGFLLGTALLGALLPFVSNAAHAGGAVAGALAGALLLQVGPRLSPRAQRALAAAVALGWLIVGGRTAQRVLARHRIPPGARAVELEALDCDRGDADACFQAGLLYDFARGVERQGERAAGYYEKACDGGQAPGCNNLGVMYARGADRPKDRAAAEALYEKACKAGNAKGCENLEALRRP